MKKLDKKTKNVCKYNADFIIGTNYSTKLWSPKTKYVTIGAASGEKQTKQKRYFYVCRVGGNLIMQKF